MVFPEEGADGLERDGREADERTTRFAGMPALVEALPWQVPAAEGVKKCTQENISDEIRGPRERLDGPKLALGAAKEHVEGSLTASVEALEVAEQGSDPDALFRIQRLVARLAHASGRANGLAEQAEVLNGSPAVLAEVVEDRSLG
jgi:hypothetical protein